MSSCEVPVIVVRF